MHLSKAKSLIVCTLQIELDVRIKDEILEA
jgi:hypothetical protein